jgi:hypothetical protein
MEKFSGTPTPALSPVPTEAPIDPADVVQVDTSLDGDNLSVNSNEPKKSLSCTKYNNVMINSDSAVVTIKGACRRLTINGDGNKVTADAVAEIALNGKGNDITYSRFANGKRPVSISGLNGNTLEKVSGQPDPKQSK